MVKVRASDETLTYNPTKGAIIGYIEVKLKDKFDFKCQRCGSCCSNTPGINHKESSRISEYLGISKADFIKDYTSIEPDPFYAWKVKLSKKNGSCVFLKEDEKKREKYCEIYKVAPRQCQARPLSGNTYFGETVRPKAMKIQINPCPGLGKGSEQTVKKWIRGKNLVKLWQEEADYRKELNSLMCTAPEETLMSSIIDMFLV
jgi:Fe-S-cluster containining protein